MNIASAKPNFRPASIADVQVFETVSQPFRRGPFKSKSGANLFVDLVIPGAEIMYRFFKYNTEELGRIDKPMKGFRIYRVEGIPLGTLGGTEFHRIREELVFGLSGEVEWECEDLYGGKRTVSITPTTGVWMPPFVLHTYRAKAEESGLQVLCNTLLYPDEPETSDTYSHEAFETLACEYR